MIRRRSPPRSRRRRQSDRPTLIACATTIGFGAPTKAGTNKVHGSPLGAEEIAGTRKALDWPYPPFEVPADILERLAAGRAALGQARATRGEAASVRPGRHERASSSGAMSGDLPEGFDAAIAAYKKKLVADKPKVATRKSSEMALEVINGVVPETIGGSADLTGSNNTKTSQTKNITPDDYGGRYVHYGIREHGMAAALNGMALHGGLIPYSGTFLCFSDYARPSMRLASLMGIRSIFVMTHDSIGLGEDGPTHQPVEQLAALRAIPNHIVFRPADATEAAECWQLALESDKTPSTLALTRQNLPAVRTEFKAENLCRYGAYELAAGEGEAKVTIFASGSEVEIALAARELLMEHGHPARVVSVPASSCSTSRTKPIAARRSATRRSRSPSRPASARAGTSSSARDGMFIGMHGFGASGPSKSFTRISASPPKRRPRRPKPA